MLQNSKINTIACIICKIEKNIRIVKIERFELVSCGGTHLRNLGGIQKKNKTFKR